MLSWLRSLFGQSRPAKAAAGAGVHAQPARAVTFPKASAGEIAFAERAFARFRSIGLIPNPAHTRLMRDYVGETLLQIGIDPDDEVAPEADRLVGMVTYPNLTLLWMDGSDSGAPRPFLNATVLADHCYDGVGSGDFSEVFATLIALTGDDLRGAVIEVGPISGNGEPVACTATINGRVKAFTFRYGKDFDTRVFEILNSLMPDNVPSRFGFLGDGGSILVLYLPPTAIAELSDFCSAPFEIPSGSRPN